VVSTTTAALSQVFNGYQTWSKALASGAIRVEGPATLARALPRWFLWSPFADDTRRRLVRAQREVAPT
jgi:hypothetical protein